MKLENPIPPLTVKQERNFWRKVNMLDPSGCWIWTASVNGKGKYGCFGVDGKIHRAHRVSYFQSLGEIPVELQIDHTCRNHRCVNPAHLEPVTNQVNCSRRSSLLSKCKRGHTFDIVLKNGKRSCTKCQKILRDKYRMAGRQ